MCRTHEIVPCATVQPWTSELVLSTCTSLPAQVPSGTKACPHAGTTPSRALLLDTMGPGWGVPLVLSGGHLGSPGSGLQQGFASSQNASADVAPELSGQNQTPKCPTSHWCQKVPGTAVPLPTPHLSLGLHLPPSQSLIPWIPGRGENTWT